MAGLTPYRCPICGGKGIVPNGFYSSTEQTWSSTSTTPDQCRSCVGTGLVWSDSDEAIQDRRGLG